MKRPALFLSMTLAVAAPSAAAQSTAPVSADPWLRAGSWLLTVDVGGMAFSDFERSQARPESGTPPADAFSRRISARTSMSIGGWASYWISETWAVRAGLSYVPSTFTVWNEDAAARSNESLLAGDGEEATYASLGVWLANAVVVFRFPRSFGRVAPYGLAGAGVVRYHAGRDADLPPEAEPQFAGGDLQNVAGVFGIGATIPLQRRNLLLSFELTNHLARSPLQGPDGNGTFELGGELMQLTEGGGAGDVEVGLTSHVRLAVGLTLPLR